MPRRRTHPFHLLAAALLAIWSPACRRRKVPKGPVAVARAFVRAAAEGRRKGMYALLGPETRRLLRRRATLGARQKLEPWEMLVPFPGLVAPLQVELVDESDDEATVALHPDPAWLTPLDAGQWSASVSRLSVSVPPDALGWVSWPALGVSLAVSPHPAPRRIHLRLVRTSKGWRVELPPKAPMGRRDR